MNKDQKTGKGKLRWDLLPWESVEDVVKVINFGSTKYEPNSWRRMDAESDNRYFSALMRHLVQWRAGELIDSESGLPHLAHAACNVLFLLGFYHMREGK